MLSTSRRGEKKDGKGLLAVTDLRRSPETYRALFHAATLRGDRKAVALLWPEVSQDRIGSSDVDAAAYVELIQAIRAWLLRNAVDPEA